MNVVEFTFPAFINKSGEWADKENMVAYVGTHDNETAKGFVEKLKPEEKKRWDATLKEQGYEGTTVHMLLEFLLSLKAKWAIISLSDLLEKGNEARINVPGVIDDVNWTYREKDMEVIRKALLESKELLNKHGRL